MAARDTVIDLTNDDWVQLTDNDVATAMTVINVSPVVGGEHTGVYLKATADTTKPTAATGAPLPYFGNGFSNATLAEKFAGVSSPVRVWAKPMPGNTNGTAQVYVSHAAA